jgi:hypothetical protein
MKWIRSIGFLAGLAGLLCVASGILEPKGNGIEDGIQDASAQGIFAEEPGSIDVIFLGDSEAYAAVSPMELWEKYGYTSYVCGASAQRPQEGYYLLGRVLEEQTPKLLVLEMEGLFRQSKGLEGWNEVLLGAASEKVPAIQYHNRWKELQPQDFTQRPVYDERNVLKGFIYRPEALAYPWGEYMHETSEREEMPEWSAFYLKKILELCRDKGIEILFMSSPSPVNWNWKRHNEVAAAAEEEEIPYLDLNLKQEELGIDWSQDTMDYGDHVNFSGARKVTEYLGTYLSEHYDLPDRRQSGIRELWDREYEEYRRLCPLP